MGSKISRCPATGGAGGRQAPPDLLCGKSPSLPNCLFSSSLFFLIIYIKFGREPPRCCFSSPPANSSSLLMPPPVSYPAVDPNPGSCTALGSKPVLLRLRQAFDAHTAPSLLPDSVFPAAASQWVEGRFANRCEILGDGSCTSPLPMGETTQQREVRHARGCSLGSQMLL